MGNKNENKNELSQIKEENQIAGGKLVQVQLANGNWINVREHYSEYSSEQDAASGAKELKSLISHPHITKTGDICPDCTHKTLHDFGKMMLHKQLPPGTSKD